MTSTYNYSGVQGNQEELAFHTKEQNLKYS